MDNPLIGLMLYLALEFSKNREKAEISEIITFVWLIYGIRQKDYLVVVICTIIIILSLFN